MAEERSVSDVFQDILRNLQEMVRSEIRLAKVEIHGEVKQAGSSAVWIAAGGVAWPRTAQCGHVRASFFRL